jgi:hypothetical protein
MVLENALEHGAGALGRAGVSADECGECVPFGGRASAAHRRVEQLVTLFAHALGERSRGLRVSGSVVDDNSARWQAGEQSVIFEDLAHV